MYPIETIKWITFVGFTGIYKIQEAKGKNARQVAMMKSWNEK